MSQESVAVVAVQEEQEQIKEVLPEPAVAVLRIHQYPQYPHP
jgi:hypothetical protein